MSLVELIAGAGGPALAASALGCLDRCVPLLGGDDETLRPLWTGLAEGADWGERLAKVRGDLGPAAAEAGGPGDETVPLVRGMLSAAPDALDAAALRVWADACSVAALRVHGLLDAYEDDAAWVEARRGGGAEGLPPLVAAELRRQTAVLELLAVQGTGGLRQALEISTEGRRVLRAVVSRRARGRS
ncbi:hypothetical protein [Streptomyces minutiscleroticus]|uniref:hypothetical protein n=1 Tax=Streptomyces minutiscleroticus TaxID=68238 RepID=UPI00331E6909